MNTLFSFFSSYLCKHGMRTLGTFIKPIQKGIVIDIDEKLRSSRFRTSGIGHGKSSGSIGNALMVLSNFVGDASTGIALVRVAVTSLEGTASVGSTIRLVIHTELIHKVGNDTVKVL
jgi:hypothetical protein